MILQKFQFKKIDTSELLMIFQIDSLMAESISRFVAMPLSLVNKWLDILNL